ncbi:MAG: acyl-CoA dehydrogenase family protein [Gammaproteobacteria bacterium]|jgi:alkylation response protein AidB-like acyl-CoA dehydrogenase|nr:acyl-CoA dehydrogenase family protein [Gammaproteobacteria bacterium]MDH3905740.1 acyl-CoA dehydrogenase family protein [Gammaproteobacteria bacterium]MDH4005733.1 acyl-CoA dehydrogenase family protein [Gammaproteobacteria bacterium]
MDFSLTEDQQMIRDAAREFAQNEIAPVAAEFDRSGEFPVDTIKAAAELGFMGIEIPEEYGGSGLDPVSYALVMAEISAADAAHGTIVSVNNSLFGVPLLEFGTEEQKQKYLVPVASGKVNGAYALTEPQSGSDAGSMRAKAVLSEDGSYYTINGKKSWITSGPVAKYVVFFAQTVGADGESAGISAFVVDAEAEGYLRGKLEPKLGIRASATCEIELENYRCPVEDRIGDEGQGFKIAMIVLDAGRVGVAAQSLGIAQAAYEASLEYSRERKAFGAAIGSFQSIQNKLADMRMRIEASRLLVMQAAWSKAECKKTGQKNTLNSSMAKLFASETAMWVSHQAVQIHGGMGYSKELPLERYFRDAKITEIYEGTSEIQRMVIGRLETGLR